MARNFNGTSDLISIPSGVSIPLNSAVTVAFWNYVPTAVASSAFTIGSADDPSRCQAHAPYSDGVVYWDYGSTSGGRLTANYAPYVAKWTHVGLVSSGTANTFGGIYFNGTLAASSAASIGPSGVLSGGNVGAWLFNGLYHAGSIGHFAVWTVQLTAGEMTSLAAGATPTLIRPSSLIVYYPLWGVSTTEADLSGNAQSGTCTGTTVVGDPPVGGYAPYLASNSWVPAAAGPAPPPPPVNRARLTRASCW